MIRVALRDLQARKEEGGIGLVSVRDKANSLFLRSALRMVGGVDSVQQELARYFMGQRLGPIWESVAGDKLPMGPRARVLPSYFKAMVKELEDVIVPGQLAKVTLDGSIQQEGGGRRLQFPVLQLPRGGGA